MTTTPARMRQLVGTTAQWAANDLVIGNGEFAIEVIADGSANLKVGDGAKKYSALSYVSGTFSQPYTGAVPGSMQAKAQQSVHVFDFMNATQIANVLARNLASSSVAALNAAVTALNLKNGGRIYLGPGSHVLDAAITLPGPKHFELVGESGSEASNNSGGTELVKTSAVGSTAIVCNSPHTLLQDFVLRGQAGNGGDGIQVSGNMFVGDRVDVFGMGQDGWRVGTDAGVKANCYQLRHCGGAANTRHSLHVSDKLSQAPAVGGDAMIGHILNFVSNNNGGDGVYLGNTRGTVFSGGTFQGNTGTGIHMSANAHYNSVFGGDCESNNGASNAPQIIIDAGAGFNGLYWCIVLFENILDNGTRTRIELPMTNNAGGASRGLNQFRFSSPTGANDLDTAGGYLRITAGPGGSDTNCDILLSAGSGAFIGKSGGKVGLYGVPPITRQGTGSAKAAFVANAGTAINTLSTFDGYTIDQVVKILRSLGALT